MYCVLFKKKIEVKHIYVAGVYYNKYSCLLMQNKEHCYYKKEYADRAETM